MSLYRFDHIKSWTEADLQQLPPEDGSNEYKSSRTKDDDLGNKISVAASAFWNSGGGIFIAGIDNITQQIDGGISEKVGRQTRSDWVDKQIKKTQPMGTYWIREIGPSLPNSLIQPGNIVLVIGFEESTNAPHMAYDNTYRIRAGAHSDPASHFLVEAIRARRVVHTPILRALLRRSERTSRTVELILMVLNDAPALDVKINMVPYPSLFREQHINQFPLIIPLIDRQYPFHMDIHGMQSRSTDPFNLTVSYKDLLYGDHSYEQILDTTNSIGPMIIGETDSEKIEAILKQIAKKMPGL